MLVALLGQANLPKIKKDYQVNEQQVAIITGCASGIGREVARILVEKGWMVLATDINEAGLKAYAQTQNWPDERVLLRKLDVRDQSQWQEIIKLAVDQWQQIDVVLNIAGVLEGHYFYEVNSAEIERHLDINVKGVIYGSQAATEFMLRQRFGHIVNIASIAGLLPTKGLSLYVASKFAVRGFSLSIAQELRPFGIQVTTVCPDVVQTPMVTSQLDRPQSSLLFYQTKMLIPEHVAEVITGKVLQNKPLEVFIPWTSGLTAKFGTLMPGLAGRFLAAINLFARSQQKKMRHQYSGLNLESGKPDLKPEKVELPG